MESGVPELAEAVQDQSISINADAEIVRHPPEEQRRRLPAHRERGSKGKRQKGTPKMKAAPKPDTLKKPEALGYLELWLRNGARAIQQFRDHRECLSMLGRYQVQLELGEVVAVVEFLAALCAADRVRAGAPV